MDTKKPVRQKEEPFRRQRTLAVLSAVVLLLGSLCFAKWMLPERKPALAELKRPVLLIDPGHGGFDGGAIAYNGVKESDLNLSIAIKMRDLAAFYGISAAMTRQDDNPRTDAASYSEHEDLVYRADLANSLSSFCQRLL